MSQRRMPSGQGPSARPAGASRARPGARLGERLASAGTPRVASRARPSRVSPAALRRPIVPPSEADPQAGVLRRGAGPARRIRAPRPPRRLSGRAAALGLLLVALILAYGYPVRTYLDQQAQIDRLESGQQAQRERIRQLSERLAKWDDPDYVISQARSRLQWVRKGELTYVVLTEQPPPAGQPSTSDHSPWYRELWGNVQAADNVQASDTAQPSDTAQAAESGATGGHG
ncbi:MAG TPA: septum formation initiator family protein [Micromonosporaceae bacterium]